MYLFYNLLLFINALKIFTVFISNEFIMFRFYSLTHSLTHSPILESFKHRMGEIKIVCIIIHFWMIVITQKGYSTEQFMMMNKLLLHFSPFVYYASVSFTCLRLELLFSHLKTEENLSHLRTSIYLHST